VNRQANLHVRSRLEKGQIEYNPGSIQTTELPIIKRVRAKLGVGGGSSSSTAVGNLFTEPQYWITGGDFQAAVDAGIHSPIGLINDTVGHIIGDQFGGRGNFPKGNTTVAPDNVFPQSVANQTWFNTIETQWKNSIDKGNCVCVQVTLVYGKNTSGSAQQYRPTQVKVNWWERGTTVTHHYSCKAN